MFADSLKCRDKFADRYLARTSRRRSCGPLPNSKDNQCSAICERSSRRSVSHRTQDYLSPRSALETVNTVSATPSTRTASAKSPQRPSPRLTLQARPAAERQSVEDWQYRMYKTEVQYVADMQLRALSYKASRKSRIKNLQVKSLLLLCLFSNKVCNN